MTQQELEDKIIKAQESYYNDTPSMSDIEFDKLWDYLSEEYPNSPLLNKVGTDHVDGFTKVRHNIVMGSQNKANTPDDMDKFFSKNGTEYIAQLKLDGISLELNYEDGRFISGITRGDGTEGSDITQNVLKMKGVVMNLFEKFTGSVRGEILLYRSEKEQFYPDKKNCRNAASGIASRLDGTGSEHLTVMVYDAQYLDKTKSFNTQKQLQEWLKEQGFTVAPYSVISKPTGQKAVDMIGMVFESNPERDFDIDGIVWKKDQIDMNDILSNLRPKTQIALKPKFTTAVTKIINIEWPVRNGTVTPVAVMEPVELLGSTVQRASLCNISLMEDLGIEIGHEVTIIKANEIIPKIIKNNTTGDFVEGYGF